MKLKKSPERNTAKYSRDVSEKSIGNLLAFLRGYDWNAVTDCNDPIKATGDFFSIINDDTDCCFPLKLIKTKSKNIKNKIPWFTPGLALCSKNKNKLFVKNKRKPSPTKLKNYRNYKKSVQFCL